jgi:hypothetical protein
LSAVFDRYMTNFALRLTLLDLHRYADPPRLGMHFVHLSEI